jgi:hypothetical protein
VLNPTRVGKSFLLLAHIRDRLVMSAIKYSCQMLLPNIRAGIIIIALAIQLAASIIL